MMGTQMRSLLFMGVAWLLVCGAIGCSSATQPPAPPPAVTNQPQITLPEAREYQNRVLLEMAALLPEEKIVNDFGGPVERGSTLSCNWYDGADASWQHNGVKLPGRIAVDVTPDTDLDAVLDVAQASYPLKPGWHLGTTSSGGERVIQLISPEQYTFYLEYYPVANDLLRFAVTSFSPCFEAPEDYSPFDDY